MSDHNTLTRQWRPALLPILLCLASLAAQQPRQAGAGNLRWTEPDPAVWQRSDSDGWVLYRAPAPAGEYVTLRFAPGRALTGDFSQQFSADIKRDSGRGSIIADSEIQEQTSPSGVPLLMRSVRVQEGAEESYRLYVGAHPGDRYELAIYAASDQALYQKHLAEVAAVLDTVRFANVDTEAADDDASGPASSATGTPADAEAEFLARDGNRDGWLSGTEIKGVEAFDRDGDKEVTKAEFLAGRLLQQVAAEAERAAQTPGTAGGVADDPFARAKPTPAAPAPPAGPTAPTAAYSSGSRVEVVDRAGVWYKATVIGTDQGRCKVHYDDFGDYFDEWVTAERMRPLGATTPPAAPTAPAVAVAPAAGGYQVGSRVEAMDRFGGWYKASIIAVEAGRFRVHFDGYSDYHDEWVTVEKLRPLAGAAATPTAPAGTTTPAGTAGQTAPAAAPAPLPAGKGGLDGLFFQLRSNYFNGSLSFSPQHYYFRPNGEFYLGVPPGGLEKFNAAELAAAGDKSVGRYSVVGDKLHYQLAGQKHETETLKRLPDGDLEIDGLFARKVYGLKTNYRLDGKYSAMATSSGSGGFLSSVKQLTFKADGSYAGWAGGAISGPVTAHSEASTSGRYFFDGYSLTLAPAEGPRQVLTVYALPSEDEDPPERLGIDGVLYHRED